ncbi:IS30 family transposase [Micromonospora aurantiaca (nom. illeg.)]|uniref:IS30 family transposase n=1 Tax=Micromonospora aurantiaca (nom. illeg.) TaxID=47850 RepID=UPI001656D971|nr:IS30 family transposase [Micromonospora aurantiaca]MBC9003967.1 IS30 family transposase [Micromonospora aurantiaca]
MPRYAPNKMPAVVKRRYFELIRTGLSGAAAAQRVGVSLSCGSLWFIDAGRVSFVERPISPRYLSQDDRIEIADGLARGEPIKAIAARIGKSYQSVYREIARNRKPDGRYQPWYAHNQAYLRRQRPKPRRFVIDGGLREVVADRLRRRWSPPQISRWLRRRYRRRQAWHVCAETIYEAVYRGGILPSDSANLRTGRTYRHRRGRGRSREGALKQSTNMKSIRQRPASVASRRQVGHWEGDLIVGAGQRSAIATLVERKTRLAVLVRLPRGHNAQSVGDALIDVFTRFPPPLRRSLTWDQGNEMFHHERIEHVTGLKIYFADPHSPWQRGTNENTNGLLRQYLPKGTNLGAWTSCQLDRIAAELNDRPRLCLNDSSPNQMMRRWQRQSTR